MKYSGDFGRWKDRDFFRNRDLKRLDIWHREDEGWVDRTLEKELDVFLFLQIDTPLFFSFVREMLGKNKKKNKRNQRNK